MGQGFAGCGEGRLAEFVAACPASEPARSSHSVSTESELGKASPGTLSEPGPPQSPAGLCAGRARQGPPDHEEHRGRQLQPLPALPIVSWKQRKVNYLQCRCDQKWLRQGSDNIVWRGRRRLRGKSQPAQGGERTAGGRERGLCSPSPAPGRPSVPVSAQGQTDPRLPLPWAGCAERASPSSSSTDFLQATRGDPFTHFCLV